MPAMRVGSSSALRKNQFTPLVVAKGLCRFDARSSNARQSSSDTSDEEWGYYMGLVGHHLWHSATRPRRFDIKHDA